MVLERKASKQASFCIFYYNILWYMIDIFVVRSEMPLPERCHSWLYIPPKGLEL